MFTKSGLALPKAQLKFLVTLPFLATYNLTTHPPFAPAPRLVPKCELLLHVAYIFAIYKTCFWQTDFSWRNMLKNFFPFFS